MAVADATGTARGQVNNRALEDDFPYDSFARDGAKDGDAPVVADDKIFVLSKMKLFRLLPGDLTLDFGIGEKFSVDERFAIVGLFDRFTRQPNDALDVDVTTGRAKADDVS